MLKKYLLIMYIHRTSLFDPMCLDVSFLRNGTDIRRNSINSSDSHVSLHHASCLRKRTNGQNSELFTKYL